MVSVRALELEERIKTVQSYRADPVAFIELGVHVWPSNSTRSFGSTGLGGSHPRMKLPRDEYRITIPRHKPLRVGTLSHILTEIATYLEVDREELIEELFP
jgi:hypothetical protein